MNMTTRPVTVAVTTLAAAAAAGPALAATQLQPTSLNLRAAHATVRPHHTDTLTATLTSKGKGLDGQSIIVQERTAPTTGHRTVWEQQPVTVTPLGNGRYQFAVTPPIAASKNTQKDQYRAVFQKTDTYAGSRSEVITVTVKRATA